MRCVRNAGVGRERFERRGHASHRVGSRRVPGLPEDLRGIRGKFGQGSAPRLERSANVGRLAGQLRSLCLAKPFAGVQQPIEGGAVLPEQLVHRPRSDGWFGERLDSLSGAGISRLLHARCQRIARRGELGQRQSKEPFDVVVDALLTLQLFHFSTFPLAPSA